MHQGAMLSIGKTLLRSVGILLVLGLLAAGTFLLEPLWINDHLIRYKLWRQHVRSESIKIEGYRVHYFEATPSTAPTAAGAGRVLILVHGLGARGEDWSPLIPSLAAAGFHVYVPDLLGYGRSAKPNVGYSIALEEELIANFMHALRIEHADVGGWSMGGWVALKLAADHPTLVDRLIVLDSAGVYFPATFDATLFTPTDAAGLSHLVAMLTPHPQPVPAFASRAVIRRLHANAWVVERSVQSMESGRDLMDFRLNEIHQPTLVVWGRLDQLIPLSAGEVIHHKIPGSSMLIVDGCGHLAPSECWKPVLHGMLGFLTAQPPLADVERSVAGKP